MPGKPMRLSGRARSRIVRHARDHLREARVAWHCGLRVSYQPPPDLHQSATPPPSGQHSPDGRWYWDGRQWIPVTIPGRQWARPYAPPDGRADAAVALVALAMVGLGLLAVESTLDVIRLAAGHAPAVIVTEALFLVLSLIAYLPGLIGGAIVVPMWMHRAFRNLPALGEQGMRWSPAWAAGGWFIPFANLVIPYQVMRVLWGCFGDERSLPEQWWAAWIGFLVLRSVGYVVAVVNQPFGDVLGALGEAIGIVAGFLLITMIRRITRRERDRRAEIRDY